MFEFIKDIGNYDSRKVSRTKVNGVIVSTAYTSDEGYETAIMDVNGVHPVQRYESIEDAKIGHKKWCKKAETVDIITKLCGFGGFVESEKVKIVREKHS